GPGGECRLGPGVPGGRRERTGRAALSQGLEQQRQRRADTQQLRQLSFRAETLQGSLRYVSEVCGRSALH
nr:hypothetical protein [Tanacetum cinerariifolium]